MIKLDANKIMQGSPPPQEYQVTLENWSKYPYNIWAFVNVRSIIPTSSIKFDPKLVSKTIGINVKEKDKEYKNLTIKIGEIFSEIEPIIKPSMLIGSILNAKITVIR